MSGEWFGPYEIKAGPLGLAVAISPGQSGTGGVDHTQEDDGTPATGRMAQLEEQYRDGYLTTIEYGATASEKDRGTIRARIYLYETGPVDVAVFSAPADAIAYRFLERYDKWPRHASIESEYVGYASLAPVKGAKQRKFIQPDGRVLYVVAMLQKAWTKGTPRYGQIQWDNGGRVPTCSYGVVDPTCRLSDYRGAQKALQFVARIEVKSGGRHRLEESPSSSWRHFAEQATELLRTGEVQSVRDAAARLMVDYDSLPDDPRAETKAELAAERRLYRYIKLLQQSRHGVE